KFAVWTLVVRAAGYPVATARNAALGLTQIGEFSYILAGVGRNHGLLPSAMYDAVLATSLVTILIKRIGLSPQTHLGTAAGEWTRNSAVFSGRGRGARGSGNCLRVRPRREGSGRRA